ncbi:MAG: hypothetical protein BGO69_06160 [Bacteroidetes bacterium 46-16]|mgnify:CR=1 FL=1|nr:MAG: hypothetical protein BGO69_06160 [Bacteroidetes bacterium 46-16]
MFKRFFIILCAFIGAQHVYAQGGDTIHIYFERNIENLDNTGKAIIDSLIGRALITERDNLNVIGYADYLGNELHNQALSDARAKSVAGYLIAGGLPSDNIKICMGKGQVERFVQKNPDGFPADRRVDIVIVNAYVPPPADTDLTAATKLRPGNTAKGTGRILVDDNNAIQKKKKKEPHEPSRILKNDPNNVTIVVKPGTHTGVPDDFKSIGKPSKDKQSIADLSKYKAGETIVLENIYFYPESHLVRKQSVDELQKLFNMLDANPRLKIRIEGHVCCVTDVEDAYDIDSQDNHLSLNRAKYIYDYLVANGVEPERLKYIGYGRSKPVVPVELNEADANKNRRVEIRILEK